MIHSHAREARRHSPALFAALGLCASVASAQLPSDVPSLAPMIEKASPAVVNIAVSGSVKVDNSLGQDEFLRKFFDFGGEGQNGRREIEAAGSGVIVDAKKGYILTNHHVVENADKITVTLADNRSLSAKVIGSDEGSDLAVLQVKDETLVQMPFGDSGKLRVGDYVVAIGNPFGFSNTVTSGIVSALGRSGINRDAYEDFIQTDASINPGNSGGALVNLRGELVGINSAIISRSGGNIGIGFAIPVNMARSIMDQLVTYGSVSRGLLGVGIQDVTPDLAVTYNLHDNSGALVKSVGPNSAAERAGIQVNDVIVSINEHAVRDSGSLKAAIGLLRPGEKVVVGVIRDAHPLKVNAVLGEAPAAAAHAAPSEEQPGGAPLDPAFEGAELSDNDAKLPGLLVTRVEPGSPAADRGLHTGDVITKVNRVRVHNLGEAKKVIEGARSIILEVQRGGRNQLILMR
ncbi:MAG TPA: DegQ family serine endoprotease [Gammaproteobacteria bacterium]|nr:DegQ family serine endoprotease [Gammaproteobacteria bacterium]